jgi:hypothetical protein
MEGRKCKIAFSLREAAAACGLSRTSILTARRRGLLNARKMGRRVVIEAGELERFISALPLLTLAPPRPPNDRLAIQRPP